eukprot:jgi/Ulvmu1/6497/UM003_0130.1
MTTGTFVVDEEDAVAMGRQQDEHVEAEAGGDAFMNQMVMSWCCVCTVRMLLSFLANVLFRMLLFRISGFLSLVSHSGHVGNGGQAEAATSEGEFAGEHIALGVPHAWPGPRTREVAVEDIMGRPDAGPFGAVQAQYVRYRALLLALIKHIYLLFAAALLLRAGWGFWDGNIIVTGLLATAAAIFLVLYMCCPGAG